MCGRFVLKKKPVEMIVRLKAAEPPNLFAPRFNIAPSQPVMAIRTGEGGKRETVLLQWGLVPGWADDPAIGFKMINARSETAAEKPSFRAAFKHRRCLIPADGFYEWAKKGKAKQPFYIHRADGQPLAMAGLWEHWQDPHGNELETCTILTTQANTTIAPLHERMPVILEPEDWDRWLKPGGATGDSGELHQLMRPAAEGVLALHPVSSQVNSPSVDKPDNLQPVEIKEPDRPAKSDDQPTLF